MIARIAFPIAVPGIFDYKIPERFRRFIAPGVPVRVELRKRTLWGVVVELSSTSPFTELKEILDIKSRQWSDSSQKLVTFYKWIASYYQSELGKVFKPLIKKSFIDIKPKKIACYRYSGTIPDNLTDKQKKAALQVRFLTGEVTRKQLLKRYHFSDHIVAMLVLKEVLLKTTREVIREPSEMFQMRDMTQVILTEEQSNIVDKIWHTSRNKAKPFLLYGITGSGKTHVYIELARRTLRAGSGVIILVPEISLTAQTIKQFRDAIGYDIAVIHSRMSDGERRDSIEELVSGRKRIVIGARSAILVPMDPVGLIVVDEEHDGSYKQSDPEPRYHARDVAVMRGKFQEAHVVMGSATPSLESYYNAQQGKYTLVELTRRFGKATLPRVEIVDMNKEHQKNNWTFLSRFLQGKIQETLENNRQVILLLNRRGFSVLLLCTECGHTYACPNCSVNLIYHQTTMTLKCHQCGWQEMVPEKCTKCGGKQIKYKGTGIQKVEEFLKGIFPRARILRMDQDSTRRKGTHIAILEAFANREADILIGTQMVAKGLNFPGVKLVGVLQADIGLHFPDFRASERTFQLLTQVAGRAGRKDSYGEVIIQTYSPQEPSIIAAKEHDFIRFFHDETVSRKELGYPPYTRLVRVIVKGSEEVPVKSCIEKIATLIRSKREKSLTVLGPAPAVLARLKSTYRYSILIKSTTPRKMQAILAEIQKDLRKIADPLKVLIDVDPINML